MQNNQTFSSDSTVNIEKSKITDELAKGLALFLGLYCIVSLAAGCSGKISNLNTWWIDLQPLPKIISNLFLAVTGILLFFYGLLPRLGPVSRKAALVSTALIALFSMFNTFHFFILAKKGAFSPGFSLPLSLFIFILLAFIFLAIRKNRPVRNSLLGMTVRLAVIGAAVSFAPLSQMIFFGKSDYRRPADAIVVFGAKAYADGSLSDALADRVRTGCELYKQGYADLIIFSGGPGKGKITEPEAMRSFALRHGVPEEAILIDCNGLNTRMTVENTSSYFRKHGIRRVLAVSHFYHLPRIKMSFSRQGFNAYTVPAKESYFLTQMPFLLVRETAAMWYYYFTLILK